MKKDNTQLLCATCGQPPDARIHTFMQPLSMSDEPQHGFVAKGGVANG